MIDTQQQYIKLVDERQHIHISGDSSPICKRHLESMLKGINVTQKYGVPQSDEQV
jgi:hypothetical protein